MKPGHVLDHLSIDQDLVWLAKAKVAVLLHKLLVLLCSFSPHFGIVCPKVVTELSRETVQEIGTKLNSEKV